MSLEVPSAFLENLSEQVLIRFEYLLVSHKDVPQKAISNRSNRGSLLLPLWIIYCFQCLLQGTYHAKDTFGGDVEHTYKNTL
jgi:hypothetical protein